MNLVGIVNALLLNIATITGMNDPQLKITPPGFLNMLLENNVFSNVSNLEALRNGYDRDIKVRYMKRGVESEVEALDDCNTPVNALWSEATVTHSLFSKIGIFIPDELTRKLEEVANSQVSAGVSVPLNGINTNIKIDVAFARVLYQTLLAHLNGIIQKIDANLLSAQATAWGTNAAYGDSNPHTINFGKELNMDDGIVKLLLDAQANEIAGKLLLVGNGVVNAYQVLNGLKQGLDKFGYGQQDFSVYNDPKSATVWGVNHFGAFAQGLVSFVDWNKNVKGWNGQKGDSIFFTLPVPVQLANGTLSKLVFDCQLKYETCPIFNDDVKVADRGIKLIVSKHYGLFNAPGDMFNASDRLYGFNGSLHYIGAPQSKVVTTQPADGAVWETKTAEE
jgi:hypothetical protein